MTPRLRRLLGLLLALTLVVVACGEPDSAPTTTRPAGPASLPDEIAELIAVTEEIRGLRFFEPPVVTVVSSEELAQRVRAQIDEELPEDYLTVWQGIYGLLGILDEGVDLGDAYRDLYAEQVGGYYDDETGDLVVATGASLTPMVKVLVVHELIHALTDQHFGYSAVVSDLLDQQRYEEARAVMALVEGDATYFQLVYLQSLPVEEQVAAIEESLATDTTVLESLPPWFAEELAFPYDAGFRFVSRLVRDQGVAGVDQAYRLYPETTEQILYPEKYFVGEPARPVDVLEVEVPGYEVFEEGRFGEWATRVFLLDGLPRGDAVVATAGWGGDHYRIYWSESQAAMVYVYEGDTPRDAQELADGLARSVDRTMAVGPRRTEGGVTTFSGGRHFAYVASAGSRVLFVAAHDGAVGSFLVEGLRAAVLPEEDEGE